MNMDIALHYREKGKGIPFILLHGNGEDCSYFKNQIDYFGRRYKVMAVDTRGHGKTERGAKPFTIKQFADDLYGFTEEQNISKAIILGFSDGANIAMEFAMKYPGKVTALILNGGNLNPKGVRRRIQIPIEIGYKIAMRFAHKSKEAKRHAEMLSLMVNGPDIEPLELSKIKAPTLVICGSRDMIKAFHTKEIAESIKDAKLVTIEGDHFIANKKYDVFNKEVDKFLKTVLGD